MKTPKLQEAINTLKEFPNVDDFVARKAQPFMNGGEPDDNSLELAAYWNSCLKSVLQYAQQSPPQGVTLEERIALRQAIRDLRRITKDIKDDRIEKVIGNLYASYEKQSYSPSPLQGVTEGVKMTAKEIRQWVMDEHAQAVIRGGENYAIGYTEGLKDGINKVIIQTQPDKQEEQL